MADFKPSRDEMKISEDFFERYKRCSQNHKPGDEYQLVECLAQTVGCSPLLSIVDEGQVNSVASPCVPSSYTDPNEAHERFLKEKKALHAQFVAERQAEYAKGQGKDYV